MKNTTIEDKLPEEENRFVIFLDILGFKSFYKDEKTRDQAIKFVYSLRNNEMQFNSKIEQLPLFGGVCRISVWPEDLGFL